jgi:hypothetical protein
MMLKFQFHAIHRCPKRFSLPLLSNPSRAANLHSKLLLLLASIVASSGVDALVAEVVVPGAGLDVRLLVLQLEDVLGLVGGVVDVGGQVLVLAGALEVVGLGEAAGAVVGAAVVVGDVEVVVAAGGAAEDELGDFEAVLLLLGGWFGLVWCLFESCGLVVVVIVVVGSVGSVESVWM